ncbi:histidine kinase [Fulvivirgaceae bacterium BMA10]|uniref:Histidine kinase n=1 Tax=Splendidivirga corallicola TaxID=3051826 RepID=A0ABT8KP88_9BACT|nr:histidine kinase [Fulvivirgaceae bacterium BMA10]
MNPTTNRKRLYWSAQIIGWSLYAIFGLAIHSLFDGFNTNSLLIQILGATLMIISTHMLRMIIIRYNYLNDSIKSIALKLLALGLLISIVVNILISLFMIIVLKMFTFEQFSMSILMVYTFQSFTILILWIALYMGIHYFWNYKKGEIEKWKLEASLKNAELIALKSQINPHFIFNSLNNIRALVLEDAEKARDMITHLSTLLRYSIQFNNREKVSIEDEIQIVTDYLKLESIQLEDRLYYQLDIEKDTLELKIPPMTIQLLVENAIKHGINTLPKGGQIRIRSFLDRNKLYVEVINTGKIKEKALEKGTGIGIKNASERLKLLFGKLSDLNIRNIADNEVAATFSIPLDN